MLQQSLVLYANCSFCSGVLNVSVTEWVLDGTATTRLYPCANVKIYVGSHASIIASASHGPSCGHSSHDRTIVLAVVLLTITSLYTSIRHVRLSSDHHKLYATKPSAVLTLEGFGGSIGGLTGGQSGMIAGYKQGMDRGL